MSVFGNMKFSMDRLFWVLPLLYALLYAPYGVNETDGGFITGLAWQVIQGKALYGDVVYVRPPLPVWLRALELSILPEHWQILGERWIFYGKTALYSWAGAQMLMPGARRWSLALLGFIVSVHCYPAAAWHTVDGILFSVLGFCLLLHPVQPSPGRLRLWGGVALVFAALLCKQSFYPLGIWLFVALYFSAGRRKTLEALGIFALYGLLFFGYMYFTGVWTAFLRLSSGASSGGQAWDHGVLDYGRIHPLVIGLAAVFILVMQLLTKYAGKMGGGSPQKLLPLVAWNLFLGALLALYVGALLRHREFTVPIAQSRLLFDMAAVYGFFELFKLRWSKGQQLRFWTLMAVSWCAAMSWGYNFPVLFATPWVFILMDLSERLFAKSGLPWRPGLQTAGVLIWAFLLAAAFFTGYQFVYRDGLRKEMTAPLGNIFPQLSGIYSDPETAALYRELKELAAQYGPDFKTLPAFPAANYLTGTRPPLPLDWVVRREMNRDSARVMEQARPERRLFYFLEKKYDAALQNDPELSVVRQIRQKSEIIAETPHFWVLKEVLVYE